MSKPPKELFLQWGVEGEGAVTDDVTWSRERINRDDIEYVRAELTIPSRVVVLEAALMSACRELDLLIDVAHNTYDIRHEAFIALKAGRKLLRYDSLSILPELAKIYLESARGVMPNDQ